MTNSKSNPPGHIVNLASTQMSLSACWPLHRALAVHFRVEVGLRPWVLILRAKNGWPAKWFRGGSSDRTIRLRHLRSRGVGLGSGNENGEAEICPRVAAERHAGCVAAQRRAGGVAPSRARAWRGVFFPAPSPPPP